MREAAVGAMARAARFFSGEVATQGGYLWQYKSDMSMREGEGVATASMIWVQPPGTPSVGMAFLGAYEATGDERYLAAAQAAAQALVWGQLASGGWDYRIDFDAEGSKQWYYRRDVEAGDVEAGERRNTTTLDDDNTQSALRLLMRVDRATGFADAEVQRGVEHGLEALLGAQYPNGAWPQRYSAFPEPEGFPVKKARYPESWSRTHPRKRYQAYYTFNDNTMADTIEMMLAAHRTYGDERYLAAARRGGEFMILAQMPEPQPAWAQQYNADMEPAWARRFEPPAVTGGESFGVMRSLLDLYVETGEERFLEPVPRALAWAERSVLPDGNLARFYELRTNKPLYFTLDYELTYSDADMPTHYAFKVSAGRIASTRAYYERIQQEGRETVLAERRTRQESVLGAGQSGEQDIEEVRRVIEALDERGRWVESGQLRDPENRGKRIEAEVISCRTFVRNMRMLARYVGAVE